MNAKENEEQFKKMSTLTTLADKLSALCWQPCQNQNLVINFKSKPKQIGTKVKIYLTPYTLGCVDFFSFS